MLRRNELKMSFLAPRFGTLAQGLPYGLAQADKALGAGKVSPGWLCTSPPFLRGCGPEKH